MAGAYDANGLWTPREINSHPADPAVMALSMHIRELNHIMQNMHNKYCEIEEKLKNTEDRREQEQDDFAKAIKNIIQQNQEQTTMTNNDHKEEIRLIRDSHKKEIATLVKKHERDASELEKSHKKKIAEIATKLNKSNQTVKSLTESNKQVICRSALVESNLTRTEKLFKTKQEDCAMIQCNLDNLEEKVKVQHSAINLLELKLIERDMSIKVSSHKNNKKHENMLKLLKKTKQASDMYLSNFNHSIEILCAFVTLYMPEFIGRTSFTNDELLSLKLMSEENEPEVNHNNFVEYDKLNKYNLAYIYACYISEINNKCRILGSTSPVETLKLN